MDTAVRSLTVMWDGSLVVAANNNGTCYVWRLLRGTQVLHLIFLQIYIFVYSISLHRGYFLCYTFPFISFNHISSRRFGEFKIVYRSRMMEGLCSYAVHISVSGSLFCPESLKVGPCVY